MNRSDVRAELKRIDRLVAEIDSYAPATAPKSVGFRSDLAGLLTVMVCATYENCVKGIIQDYAGRGSPFFRLYTENQYAKIDSRIDVNDLKKYAKTFHPDIGKIFDGNLKEINAYFLKRTKVSIKSRYSQILEWRHDFAHTGSRVTTVEEVIEHHRYAQRVLTTFADSFLTKP